MGNAGARLAAGHVVGGVAAGAGFLMPVPQIEEVMRIVITDGVLRLLLWLLVGENYDEAVHRKHADRVTAVYHKVAQWLLRLGLAVHVFMYVANMDRSGVLRGMVLFEAFYAVLFAYRMPDAIDPDKKAHFEHLRPKFYLYYPLIDERKDFTRSVKMEGRNELSKKGTQLEHMTRVDLFTSIVIMLAWATWGIFVYHAAPAKGLNFVMAAIYALFPTVMMAKNWGLVRFVDALQRYVFMATLRLPVRKFSSIKSTSSRASWESQGALPKAMYNMYNSWFTPITAFMHKNVYKKMRGDMGMTIGKSMAATSLIRAAIFMGAYTFMELQNDKLLDVNENTKLLTLSAMSIGYLTHAYLLWMYEDRDDFAKSYDYQRNDKTRDTLFIFHKIGVHVLDHLCFTTPLVYSTFRGVTA